MVKKVTAGERQGLRIGPMVDRKSTVQRGRDDQTPSKSQKGQKVMEPSELLVTGP